MRMAQAAAKKVNPNGRYGMYWRTDFAMELAECSDNSAEWNAHAAEWTIKSDAGKPLDKAYIDYSNPAAANFFAKVLLDTLADGTLDYVYLDGFGDAATASFPGVSPTRSTAIVQAKHQMISSTQAKLDALGKGQGFVLNGCDNQETAQEFASVGTIGAMFDHWSILQFIQRGPGSTGQWNTTLMDQAFELVTSPTVANMTVQIKGWPGPIIKQRDQYPSNGPPTPQTPAEFAEVASARFNNELAIFLLVANEFDTWIYSWFWGFYDYVPGDPTSTIPAGFFPEANCKLGAPKGPYTRDPATMTYTRDFEHAHVFVDLKNRTACSVKFDTPC